MSTTQCLPYLVSHFVSHLPIQSRPITPYFILGEVEWGNLAYGLTSMTIGLRTIHVRNDGIGILSQVLI